VENGMGTVVGFGDSKLGWGQSFHEIHLAAISGDPTARCPVENNSPGCLACTYIVYRDNVG